MLATGFALHLDAIPVDQQRYYEAIYDMLLASGTQGSFGLRPGEHSDFGVVRLGGNENEGLGFRRVRAADVPWRAVHVTGAVELSKDIASATSLTLQMVAESNTWFGEKVRVKLLPCPEAASRRCDR